ncbi:MAG: hypothetical protein R3F39_00500 [Myxococcota bacterium]
MKQFRAVAISFFALSLTATAAHAEAGKPNALEVGPTDAPFVVAATAVGRLEDEVFTFLEQVERLGLEDPGLRTLRAKTLEKLGKKKGSVIRAAGIDPKGAMAVYGVTVEGRLTVGGAVDIIDRDAFVRALAVMQEEAQWVPYGEKPKRAVITKRELGGGGFEATVGLPESSGVTVRVHEGVAVFAAETAVLDSFRLAGGQRIDIADRLPADGVGLVVRVRPTAGGMTQEVGIPIGAVLEHMEAVWRETPDGFLADGTLRFATDLEPWLALARPGPAGEAARGVMKSLVGPETGLWLRWSVDAQAAWSLAKTLLGDALGDVQKEIKRETGLDMKRDIVDAVTGDLLFACDDGILSCVAVFGTSKGGRALSSVKRAMDRAARDNDRMRLVHERSSLPGGRTLYRTQVEEKRWKAEETGPDEWNPMVQFYWGARDHALIIGLTRDGVMDALTRSLSGPGKVPDFLVGRGFDAETGAAYYQRGREPMRILRMVAAVLRAVVPSEAAVGIAARAFEFYAAAEDFMWERASILKSNGLDWSFHGLVTTLPSEGSTSFDAALAKAWEAALSLRYRGRTRQSNEAMLDLATRAPDSPWGMKAKLYALASDDASMLTTVFYMAGLVSARSMMQATMPSEEIAPAQPSACLSLESMTCSGPSYNQGSCQIAMNGMEADCEAELQAVLSAP